MTSHSHGVKKSIFSYTMTQLMSEWENRQIGKPHSFVQTICDPVDKKTKQQRHQN